MTNDTIVTIYWVITVFQMPCFVWIITVTPHFTDEDTEAAGSGGSGGSEKPNWVFRSRACTCNSLAVVPSMSSSNIFGARSICSFSSDD